MALKLWVALVATSFLGIVAKLLPPDINQTEAEQYIVESEKQWAEAVASGDSSVARRILAEDFLGVEPDGSFYDKAKEIENAPDGPRQFVSNHANEIRVRFYGDAAVAQGSESWVRRSGSPKRGRYVWTDTWIKRDGKWQVVAAEDVGVPDTER